jgi:DNA invertase Pin-like site-specific DNA recombinase
MKIGYRRVSTEDQTAGYEDQLRQLEAAGAEKVYGEMISAVSRERTQLDLALEYVREGDEFIVTKLDRLARSLPHLLDVVATLDRKKVALKILDMNLDTSTATGRLILSVLGSVAAFERELLLERQRAGVEKAKREGKYRGRKPTAMARADEILALKAEGWNPAQIAQKLGLKRTSLYNVFKNAAAGNVPGHAQALPSSPKAAPSPGKGGSKATEAHPADDESVSEPDDEGLTGLAQHGDDGTALSIL